MVKAYETLSKTAVKDCQPYILSFSVGQAIPDPRSQGYTLIAKTEFKSLDDMKYYDDECEAHKKLKGEAKGLAAKGEGVEGMCCVYFEPEIEG